MFLAATNTSTRQRATYGDAEGVASVGICIQKTLEIWDTRRREDTGTRSSICRATSSSVTVINRTIWKPTYDEAQGSRILSTGVEAF